MCNQKFFVLVSLLVATYADELLPTMPPLIQHFARIQSCKMTVYSEYPSTTVSYFDYKTGSMKSRVVLRGGTQTFCCKGWEDAEGAFDATSICSKQQPNSTPYITKEEYNDVLTKVAEIRSVYERFKALEALKEKANLLLSRVRSQKEKMYQLLSGISI